jgi:hypothetical protein
VYDLLAQKLQKGVPRAVLAGIPPSIRVETTNWKGWLGTYRLRHLYDLFAEPQNVGELHRRRLHWAHFDTSITASSSAGLQSLLDAVRTTRSESTPREITTMIGFVVAEAMDLPCGLGKATKAKYRRAVEEAGVRIVPEITTASAAVAIRLNFDGGRVETVPAR